MDKALKRAILFILSLALGIFCIVQYQTSKEIRKTGMLPEEQMNELEETIAKLNREREGLEDELTATRDELRQFQDEASSIEAEYEKIKDELKKQQVLSGNYDVTGKGAIITVSAMDGYPVNIANEYLSIAGLISYLNNAGVEAISINGQRYTSYTEIVPVSNYLNINRTSMVLPLEIKVIGDGRTIESALSLAGSGITNMLNGVGLNVDIEKVDSVVIEKVDKEKELRYAVPVVAEDMDTMQPAQ